MQPTTPLLPSDDPGQRPVQDSAGHELRAPNVAMLQALDKIKETLQEMNPKQDPSDYLREARSGAMYGYENDA